MPLVFIIAVFMYFIQCLMRTCVESARNKYFTDFKASNCSNRHIGDQSSDCDRQIVVISTIVTSWVTSFVIRLSTDYDRQIVVISTIVTCWVTDCVVRL